MKFLVAEQQILLFAAYKTRSKMIRRFGDSIEGLWAFPRQETSAQASEDQLMPCGLSKREAEYIREFALKVVEGSIDLDKLKESSDEEVREIGGIRLCATKRPRSSHCWQISW